MKDIGKGVMTGIKFIGKLACYKITFSVMDIFDGISGILSWMMKPIEAFMNALMKGLGIKLPSLGIKIPNLDINLPSFSLNFDLDFLSFNWPSVKWITELLAGLSAYIPDLVPKLGGIC